MKVGVLALQGAFLEHEQALDKLGVGWTEIRRREHFTDGLDALILPGGESTVQGKFLREEGMMQPIKEAIEGGMPVFGTCAGMILLAKKLENDSNVYFGTLDVAVRRNAYGRQLGSFRTDLDFKGVGSYPAVFIRAPYVANCHSEAKPSESPKTKSRVEVLAETGGKIVAVRQGKMLATAFHPELTDDLRIHEYFLNMVKRA